MCRRGSSRKPSSVDYQTWKREKYDQWKAKHLNGKDQRKVLCDRVEGRPSSPEKALSRSSSRSRSSNSSSSRSRSSSRQDAAGISYSPSNESDYYGSATDIDRAHFTTLNLEFPAIFADMSRISPSDDRAASLSKLYELPTTFKIQCQFIKSCPTQTKCHFRNWNDGAPDITILWGFSLHPPLEETF